MGEEDFMAPGDTEQLTEMVDDVRSGLTDFELIKKYQLTARQLRITLQQLTATGLLKKAKVYRRPVFYDYAMDRHDDRQFPRHYLARPLPIHETDSPNNRGWLTDITEVGLGTRGIMAESGDTKKFTVLPEHQYEIQEISMSASCVWSRKDHSEAQTVSGYRITEISDHDLEKIRKLIRDLIVE
jgi:hypothetical protein